jgi:carbon-monoxide dehydrogenase small subunit
VPSTATTSTSPAATEIVLPTGEPTVRVEVTSEVAATVEQVWAVLSDIRLIARCLPGAELTEDLGDDRYRGRAGVSLGPIRLSFTGLAQVVTRNAADHQMRVLAQGTDAGSQTTADIRLTATPANGGALLQASAELHLTGRIAQFGRALAGPVSRRMFEQFATAVQQTATTRVSTTPTRGWLRTLVRRLFG